MRHVTLACIAAVLVILSGQALEADILTPSSVKATSEFGLGVFLDNLIDGSGLDGVGPVEDQLHDNTNSNMWHSGCADVGIPGGTPDGECADAFAVAPVDEQIVEFELDTTYDVGAALVWQFNELNSGVGPLPDRGVKSFEMLVSPNLTDPFTSLGTFELEIGAPSETAGAFTEPAQNLSIGRAVQRVRFEILESHSDTDPYVGLSEVRFDGTVIVGPLDPRVNRLLSRDTFTDSTTTIDVTLAIVLDQGTGPFAFNIAESLPPNWTATDITGGGSSAGGEVSWSLSSVGASTNLTYTLVPADSTQADVSLAGTYSIDGGVAVPTAAQRDLTWKDLAITKQPEGGRIPEGASITLSVEVTGSEPLNYQWKKDGVDRVGATESSLTLSNVGFSDSGDYSVEIDNASGMLISDVVTVEVTPPNLALCGSASQSTTSFGGGEADRATDGDISGEAGTITDTNFGDPIPWWEVRLSEDAMIDTIVLWNQVALPERLSNFTVLVLDDARQEVFSDDFFPAGSFPPFPDPSEGGFRIDVGVEGRIVRIEKGEDVTVEQDGTILSLAEVEVFGSEPCVDIPDPPCPVEGSDDFADTHCDGMNVNPPAGNGSGDYLVTASGSDDSGDPVLYSFFAVHQQNGNMVIRGPQEVEWAYLPLTFGKWDIAVSVDDFPDCPDEADDAICTEEVNVIDPTCLEGELCNVAIRGVATQSSTFINAAPLAIDGNTNGDFSRNSVTHTGFDDLSPTWEVELDRDYEIESIVLWNRTDCCAERLTNFTVTILAADRTVVRREEFFTDGIGFPDTALSGFEISIGSETGRIVQVQLQDDHPGFNASQFFLTLAEVEIFAVVPTGDLLKPGDINLDGGVDISDPVRLLNFLFGGQAVSACLVVNPDAIPVIPNAIFLAVGDWQPDGKLDISDAVASLNHLFAGNVGHHLGLACQEIGSGGCENQCAE